MNRNTPEYREAVQRVKIDFFTEKLGMDIIGILHVGTNDGYEMQWYKKMGIWHLAGVEPLPSAVAAFERAYPDIRVFQCALSDHKGWEPLNVVTPGDGQGSSLLKECSPDPNYDYDSTMEVHVKRGDSLPLDWHLYDCLVVDVQGMELPVLKGFGERLRGFRMLNVECSIKPIYVGEAPASDVEAYLDSMGFHRMSPLEVHNDVFFVRKDCLGMRPANLKIPQDELLRKLQSGELVVVSRENMEAMRRRLNESERLQVSTPSEMAGMLNRSITGMQTKAPNPGLLVNLGSGQRPFQKPWINVDTQARWNPDIVADGANLREHFADGSAEMIVLSHTLEHYGCNEGNAMLAECYRVLRPGGSLIISVPDLRNLAHAWLDGKLSTETYIIDLYGAYMGDEADRHRFGFTRDTLAKTLRSVAPWADVRSFDDRKIPGMDLAADFWILSLEAIK